MKVLLTGASGFVGSHVLDGLRARGIPAAVLLRPASSRRLIGEHLAGLDVRLGSIDDPESLDAALSGITHVIHCAGATRALRPREFYEVNQAGTSRLVEAVNRQSGRIERLVHFSSLAAGGPALPGRPAREEDPPAPVSEYGKSKLAGEEAIRDRCRSPYVILRPPAVYGPRDSAFLALFQAAKAHLAPRPPRQPLSLVFVRDLAEVAVSCLTHPAAAGETFYTASPEATDARRLAAAIAATMKTWTLPLPLPNAAFWLLCLLAEAAARTTGKPLVLSRQKYAEIRAPGWVCDGGRLRRELGLDCPTGLPEGLGRTLEWYRRNKWL